MPDLRFLYFCHNFDAHGKEEVMRRQKQSGHFEGRKITRRLADQHSLYLRSSISNLRYIYILEQSVENIRKDNQTINFCKSIFDIIVFIYKHQMQINKMANAFVSYIRS